MIIEEAVKCDPTALSFEPEFDYIEVEIWIKTLMRIYKKKEEASDII